MNKIRNISDIELMLCDVQALYSSCTFQFLIEIIGNISLHEIESTINEIVTETPEINVYKNKNNWNKKNEVINVKNINLDDDNNLIKEDIFKKTVDFNERSIELYLLNIKNKNSRYLVFKFSHSVFDGKGALLVVENFINKICKKETYILKNDITDIDFFENIKHYNKRMFFNANCKLKNINEITKISEYNLKWDVITIDKYIQNITAKIANVLQQYYANDNVKFMIPVDLRNYDRENKIIGNLISPIYLEVNKNDTSTMIAGKLLKALKEKKELNIFNVKGYNCSKCPEKIRRFIIKIGLKLTENKNKYYFGGMISHLGRISFNESSKIKIENIISIPNHQPLTPFSITITEYENKTNIAICSYENQVPRDILDSIIKDIKELE